MVVQWYESDGPARIEELCNTQPRTIEADPLWSDVAIIVLERCTPELPEGLGTWADLEGAPGIGFSR